MLYCDESGHFGIAYLHHEKSVIAYLLDTSHAEQSLITGTILYLDAVEQF